MRRRFESLEVLGEHRHKVPSVLEVKYDAQDKAQPHHNPEQEAAQRNRFVGTFGIPRAEESREAQWPSGGGKLRAFFLHRVRALLLCKLSLRQTLRHRLSAMSYLRFRDEDDSSSASTIATVLLGAVAGFALGMVVAQRVGGFSGLAQKIRGRGVRDAGASAAEPQVADDYLDDDQYEDDEIVESGAETLEDHVLEAFRNDPILSERAVDIGGIGEATIELAGWVTTEEESEHAVTIARGVPGVKTVVNRLLVGEDEERALENARLFEEGDDAHVEAQWEGNTVGMGRSRQGNSSEPNRHQDPKTKIAEHWTSADVEVTEAADDISTISAERRHRGEKKAAKGVPKADHVTGQATTDQTT